MERSFDLTKNAFSLLEVSPRASSGDLADAKADRLFDSEHHEKDLEEAHSALLVERKRLTNEISWLSDIAPNRAREIVSKLSKISEIDAEALLGDSSQLSRLNLAADLLSRFPRKRICATELLAAFRAVDWPSVRHTIDEARALSGFGATRDATWKQAQAELIERHASVLSSSITDADDGPEWLASLLSSGSEDSAKGNLLLERTVNHYDRWSIPKLDHLAEVIDGLLANLKESANPTPQLTELESQLADWDRLSQPVQLRDQANGLNEPRSLALFYKVRDVAIWFANERQNPSVAQRITKAFAAAFSELPTVVAMTSDDLETLSENIEAENAAKVLEPLRECADEATEKLDMTARQVLAGHFQAGQPSLVGSMFKAFDVAVAESQSLPDPSLPWFIVRSVALALNNDHNSPISAKTLVEALLLNAPSAARARLDDDLAALRSTILEERFGKALSGGDLTGARAIVSELIDASPDERAKLEAVRDNLDSRLRSRNAKRVGWGMFAAVIAFLVISENASKPTSVATTADYSTDYSTESLPSSDQTTLPDADPVTPDQLMPVDTSEEAPPAYNVSPLTMPQLRFCRFESARIKALEGQVSGSAIGQFNAKVDNYNSRCGSFQYRASDLATIDAEVAADADKIQRDAAKSLARWGRSGRDAEQIQAPPTVRSGDSYPWETSPDNPADTEGSSSVENGN